MKDNFRPDRKYRVARIAHPQPLTTFSYYGGKSKVAAWYPEPKHKLIVEPFCGAAAYSWRHRKTHEVWINDLDRRTMAIWKFLQSPDAVDWLRSMPVAISQGQSIESIAPNAPVGLLELIRAEMSRGTQGRKDIAGRVTAFGAHYYWPRFATRMLVVVDGVGDWRVTCGDYAELASVRATWFIDPPYNNAAGRRYRCADVDYAKLAQWALARDGQAIVCESQGADWLPFQRLVDFRSGRQTAGRDGGEAVFIQERTDV